MIRMEIVFVILGGIILQVLILNESRVNNNIVETISNNYIAERAISIADQCLNKFTSKRLAFDEYLISNSIAPSETGKLTSLSSPGREGSESLSNSDTFDDIDDYNGFDTLVILKTGTNHGIRVRCSVSYFDVGTGNLTASKTWHKCTTIMVNDSIIGTNKHFLVDFSGKEIYMQRKRIRSFYNIVN